VILPVLSIMLLWEPEAALSEENMIGVKKALPCTPAVSHWLLSGVMTVCFIFLLAYYDRHMGQLSYESAFQKYNIFSWPRLFNGVGAVAAGFAADWRKGKLLPLFTVLVSLFMILNVILFRITTESVYLMNMSLFYFFLGTVVLFYNHSFWKIAGESERPFFWAIQGRSIEQAVTVGASLLLAGLTEEAVVALDLAAVALCVVLAFYRINRDMDKTYSTEREAGMTGQTPDGILTAAPPLTDEEQRKRFCEKYRLTERESEVFYLLLTSEESGQKMAEELFMSRRMLQRHIASIYEKTGVKTRTGLISQYYRGSIRDASEK
jgi:DNA-binding CsgD family transcriptional regulator